MERISLKGGDEKEWGKRGGVNCRSGAPVQYVRRPPKSISGVEVSIPKEITLQGRQQQPSRVPHEGLFIFRSCRLECTSARLSPFRQAQRRHCARTYTSRGLFSVQIQRRHLLRCKPQSSERKKYLRSVGGEFKKYHPPFAATAAEVILTRGPCLL